MPYIAKQHTKFKPGDLIFYRNPSEQLLSADKVQRTLVGYRLGHSATEHMAIVTAVNGDSVELAHITAEDKKTKEKHYKDKNVLGLPVCEWISVKNVEDNLLIIRHQNEDLKKAICDIAKKRVNDLYENRGKWSNNAAAKAYAKHFFSPLSSNQRTPSERKEMICTQFVSDVITRACIQIGLPNIENYSISSDYALPKIIEHTLKTKHSDKYDFYLLPREYPLEIETQLWAEVIRLIRQTDTDFGKIVDELNFKIYQSLSVKPNREFLMQSFEGKIVLLSLAKSILPSKDYKPIHHFIKRYYGLYDEDIDNFKFDDLEMLKRLDKIYQDTPIVGEVLSKKIDQQKVLTNEEAQEIKFSHAIWLQLTTLVKTKSPKLAALVKDVNALLDATEIEHVYDGEMVFLYLTKSLLNEKAFSEISEFLSEYSELDSDDLDGIHCDSLTFIHQLLEKYKNDAEIGDKLKQLLDKQFELKSETLIQSGELSSLSHYQHLCEVILNEGNRKDETDSIETDYLEAFIHLSDLVKKEVVLKQDETTPANDKALKEINSLAGDVYAYLSMAIDSEETSDIHLIVKSGLDELVSVSENLSQIKVEISQSFFNPISR